LEREQKKWDEGGGRGQERNKISSLSPYPLFLPFLQLLSIAQSETLEKQCTGSPVVNTIFFIIFAKLLATQVK